MARRLAGMSMIEVLIVIAVLGILMGIGVSRISPPSSRLLSNDIKSMLYQSRYEAVKRNQPVAFVWDAQSQTFQVRLDEASSDVADQCDGERVLVTKPVADYPRVSVTVDMATNGVVWLPSGQGRTCAGAPMVAGQIRVTSGEKEKVVSFTLGGKVSIE